MSIVHYHLQYTSWHVTASSILHSCFTWTIADETWIVTIHESIWSIIDGDTNNWHVISVQYAVTPSDALPLCNKWSGTLDYFFEKCGVFVLIIGAVLWFDLNSKSIDNNRAFPHKKFYFWIKCWYDIIQQSFQYVISSERWTFTASHWVERFEYFKRTKSSNLIQRYYSLKHISSHRINVWAIRVMIVHRSCLAFPS